MARIDAPLLEELIITFFLQLIFDAPQLKQFISRAPKFKTPDEACVAFPDRFASVKLNESLLLRTSCRQPDWQLSSLAQVCSSSLPQAFIPAVEHLYIFVDRYDWHRDIESTQWLELFHPFTAVKSLYVSYLVGPDIARALQELVTEVFPALQSLFFENPLPSGPALGQFVAARQLAGHPIAVSLWERKR